MKYAIVIAMMISGCSLETEINLNTPGFVEHKIITDKIHFYIDSDQSESILIITKGKWSEDWNIQKRNYQCNSWAYEPGMTYEISNKIEYFKLKS